MTEAQLADSYRRTLEDAAELLATDLPEGVKLKAAEDAIRAALGGIFPTAYRSPPALGEGTCGRCGDPVLWIKTVAGASMPVQPKRRVVTTEEGVSVSGFESHFAICRGGKK